MNSQELTEIGQKYVARIKQAFDDKDLNDTNGAKDSISFTVKKNKLTIHGLARVLFLEFGSGFVPFFAIFPTTADIRLCINPSIFQPNYPCSTKTWS